MPQTRLMSIRETLRLMEDSIIFTLIERSRYKSSHDCLDLFRKFWNEQNSLVFKFQSSRAESKIFSEIQEKLFSFCVTSGNPFLLVKEALVVTHSKLSLNLSECFNSNTNNDKKCGTTEGKYAGKAACL